MKTFRPNNYTPGGCGFQIEPDCMQQEACKIGVASAHGKDYNLQGPLKGKQE